MQLLLSKYWLLIAAAWYTINGILHDSFVIAKHKGGYDRELLRLLMDGHVLILSGVLLFIAYLMRAKATDFAASISLVIAIAMVIYCLMIFPFLKSFGTLIISLILIFVSLRTLLSA